LSSPQQPNVGAQVSAREQAFWDEHVPELERCVREFERGPDPNTAAVLDALEPLHGARVLDFACGAGVTTAFLAQRGAIVTGIDISPESIERGRQLSQRLRLPMEFRAGELASGVFEPASFDAVAGSYALHHVDLSQIAPVLAEILVPRGRGAFLETMALNPLLAFSRRRLSGRAGVASYGSEDEHPLTRADLRLLEAEIGPVQLSIGRMTFLRIFDRNVLRYRHPAATRALGALDDLLLRLGLGVLSYHQVVRFTRRPAAGS
jgi:SAM-dependent methyltransferase